MTRRRTRRRCRAAPRTVVRRSRTVERRPASASRPAGPCRRGGRRRPGRRRSSGWRRACSSSEPRSGEPDQLRAPRRARRDLAGVAGVHAAEQGLDEPVDDLVAEPGGRPGRRPRRRPSSLAAGAGARDGPARARPSDEHAGGGQLRRGRAGRPSASAAAGAARRGSRSGRTPRSGARRSRPSSRASVDALGAAVEHRLGADVDARRRPTSWRAACRRRAVGALEQHDLVAGGGEVAGGGQPGDPAADDDHVPVSRGQPRLHRVDPNVSSDRIAVLIDADNTSHRYAEALLDEVAKFGNPTIKRAYGDWSSPHLSGWGNELNARAIRGMHRGPSPVARTRPTPPSSSTPSTCSTATSRRSRW